ncbi:MAG: amidohydrolase family protein [Agromyces sp.]
MFDLAIRNGHAVTPEIEGPIDIGVRDGRIVELAEAGTLGPARTDVDATGLLVLPGGVEAHAHILEPAHRGWTKGEEVWLQGPEGASRAAAFGGTTTVASFAFLGVHDMNSDDPVEAVARRRELFEGKSYVDFTFHPGIVGNPSAKLLENVGRAVEAGIPTFKAFTTCVTTAQQGVKMDDGPLLELMGVLAASGGMLLVHAESDELVTHMEAKLKHEHHDEWYNLHLVHSSLSEELAFHKVCRLAREHGTAVYFVHVTGESGAQVIAGARAGGQPIYGEVLHNYLCFTAEDYKQPDGGKIQTYPALKEDRDRDALWDGLLDGSLTTVATDEYTTDYAVKVGGKTIETACGGHAGIETRGIITYTEGVATGRMSLRQFVEVFSTRPAKVLGLYPRKGAIAVGSDADFAIWDPAVERTITIDDLHHDGDYSIWEGWSARGWPVTTIVRGELVVDRGRLAGSPDHGAWQSRTLTPEVLLGPGA